MLSRILRRTPLRIYLVATVLPCAILVGGLLSAVPIRILLRDPLAAFITSPDVDLPQALYGLFSNLGVIVWCASTTISFFVYFEARHISRESRLFLLCSGIIGGMLMVDDMFMIHEAFGGTPFYIAYGCVVLLYACCFAGLVLRRLDAVILVLALALFATSVGTDSVVDMVNTGSLPIEAEALSPVVEAAGGSHRLRALSDVVEDGAKFVAIACWATFQIRAAWLLRHDR